ncbi:MAG: GNAT family N-acetyltransferase [Oscillospiraceae bacterium]|nr:GNAT family N-acetyltransferase [Oscillospiraceae bacterium]
MIVRKTRPEEAAAVNALFSVAFETSPEKGPARADDKAVCHWGAFTEEGELMSSLTVSPFSIRFDGGVCPMAGVGAVQTLPPYRRRGGVAACFARALPELYEQGVLFSYLYPFSTAFYRRFGYESCVTGLEVRLDLQQLRLTPDGGSFRLATRERPLRDAVRAVDKAWEGRWNMEVVHGEGDYGWLERLDPYGAQDYLYVCFDEAGAPRGYTAFRMPAGAEGRGLVCSRFRFSDRSGFYGLLDVFRSLAADHRSVQFTLPADPALPHLLGEWSLGAASFRLRPQGMVRAIDVAEVLRRARYRGDGALRLGIRDGQIPANDGVFALRFAAGRALSVERTEEAPDASLTVAAFSALIAGACDWEGAAAWMDGVEVRNAAAPFQGAFYRKSMTISEYF